MTPTQSRMARAVLCLPSEEIYTMLGISRVALNNAERGRKPVGETTWRKLEAYYEAKGILFGPSDWVGHGQDIIGQTELMITALNHLLYEHGIQPTADELLAAYRRANIHYTQEHQENTHGKVLPERSEAADIPRE